MDHFQVDGLPADVHQCHSERQGDWIIWRCSQCAGYERRLNWQTGEMRVRRAHSTAQHVGNTTRSQEIEAYQRGINLN
jgi:hypothetical protein